jgi:hypothetical protein
MLFLICLGVDGKSLCEDEIYIRRLLGKDLSGHPKVHREEWDHCDKLSWNFPILGNFDKDLERKKNPTSKFVNLTFLTPPH